MSYTRTLESGHYIWPDSENVNFDDKVVSDEAVDIFLYKLFNFRKEEFVDRLENGKKQISKHIEDRLKNEENLTEEDKKEIKKHLEEIKGKTYMVYESSNDPREKNIELFIDTRHSLNETAVFLGTTLEQLIKLTVNSKSFKELSKEEKENERNEMKELLKIIYEKAIKDLEYESPKNKSKKNK